MIAVYESRQGEKDEIKEELGEARNYNKSLAAAIFTVTDPFDPEGLSGFNRKEYETLLNVNEEGMMGYLEIPVIGVNLAFIMERGECSEKRCRTLKNTSLPIGERERMQFCLLIQGFQKKSFLQI